MATFSHDSPAVATGKKLPCGYFFDFGN